MHWNRLENVAFTVVNRLLIGQVLLLGNAEKGRVAVGIGEVETKEAIVILRELMVKNEKQVINL